MNIKGQLVLVTGASSGIGAATARAMAREGGRVLLLARSRAELQHVATDIKAQGGETRVYPVDLSNAGAVERIGLAIQQEVGVPDIIINNAGAGRWLPIEETSAEEAVQMMACPYFGAFYITRVFLPAMRQRNSGHIVNLTSPAGFVAWPSGTAYTVTRWAMRGFHESLWADLHNTRIGVTLMVPGKVASNYFAHNPGGEERLPGIARLYRTLTCDEVAHAIVRSVQRAQRQVIIPRLLSVTLRLHRVWPGLVEAAFLRSAARPAEKKL